MNIFNDDFRDFIQALNDNKVQYILVGGYAVILNQYRRTTGDLDVWINPTEGNYASLMKAFMQFGLPTTAIKIEDFLDASEMDVFSFGVSPVSIDIMTAVKGCILESFEGSNIYIEDELNIRYISYNELIKAKTASGRYKDLDDIEKLKLARKNKA